MKTTISLWKILLFIDLNIKIIHITFISYEKHAQKEYLYLNHFKINTCIFMIQLVFIDS